MVCTSSLLGQDDFECNTLYEDVCGQSIEHCPFLSCNDPNSSSVGSVYNPDHCFSGCISK